MGERLTIWDLVQAKKDGRKVVAVSCYDFTTARLIAQAEVDMMLVGDSAAQVMLGFDSTLPATMDFMVMITAAVARGNARAYLVADMPFLSYQVGPAEAMKNAGRFIIEAGAQMVKMEVTAAHLDLVRAVSDAGIAVMAHIGIRPQSIGRRGRLRAEGTTAQVAYDLVLLADQMVEAGASALLLEGGAAEVAEIISKRHEVPVIGCGSGAGCDGQILIAPDILGLSQGPRPKFSMAFADLASSVVRAFGTYADQVRQGQFPDFQKSYHMKQGELESLRQMLDL